MAEQQISVSAQPASSAQHEKRIAAEVITALRGLRFGSIEITVHDGKVTQIERKEKFRFQS